MSFFHSRSPQNRPNKSSSFVSYRGLIPLSTLLFSSSLYAQPTQNTIPSSLPNQVQQNRIPPQQNRIPLQNQNRNSNQVPLYQQKSNRGPITLDRSENLKNKIKELPQKAQKKYDLPQIHLALILDISGSMNGLLNQTREELWKLINLFNGIQYQGQTPEVRVSLYTQGMSNASTGLFLEQRTALITDLDSVSEVLFALKTEGSHEYSPSSLYAAALGLEWSSNPKDFKAIVIAGNEGFVQGPLSLEEGFAPVQKRQIITHTIHCGSAEQGINDGWKKAATLGEGQFLNIDQNAKNIYIETPYDDPIQELNQKLNTTYIPYGSMGRKGFANQQAQDSNALRMSKSSAIQRSFAKSGSYYNNDQWDLVDAVRKKSVNLDQVKVDQLPAEMQKLNAQERLAYVQKKQDLRNEIQKKIAQLKKQRHAYLAKERAKRLANDQGQRLDSVLMDALKKQALALGFTWKTE